MVSNKRTNGSIGARYAESRDKTEWIVVRNTHEGIVSQEAFDKANAFLE
jgi:hypothetical protein